LKPAPTKKHETDRARTFRVGARGILGTETFIAAAVETREFRSEYGAARVHRAAGSHTQRFPFGTYLMRTQHGALTVPEPKVTALVTAPGPLLCDIQAELNDARRPAARTELQSDAFQMLDDVRGAVTDEAVELCDHAELVFDPDDRNERQPSLSTYPTAITRHRFDRPLEHDRAITASRIIVLRDRRRGRPPQASRRHGADPPA
jgi:hypothetical protein